MAVIQLIPSELDEPLQMSRKGIYTISGTVQVDSVAKARNVMLLTEDGVYFLGSTVSNPTTGAYSFTGLAYNTPLLVLVPGVIGETPRIHRVTPG